MKNKTVALYLNGLNISGGMERVVSNLICQWKQDYEIILITKNNEGSYYTLPDNIVHLCLEAPLKMNMKNRYKRIWSVICNYFTSVYRLRNILNTIRADYYYVANPLNAFEFYCAAPHLVSSRLVIAEHASIYAFNKIYTWMKRIVYPKAYYISVPNKMDVPIYQSWGCNSVYIPHQFTFPPHTPNKLDTRIVLNVGRLTSDKQQDKLIRMWSKIKHNLSWKLWIVGSGEDHGKLKELITELGLDDSVELFKARKDIDSIYKQASIFAFSSRSEGFGMVLLEAMSFGIPCISFDCPSGPRDVIVNGFNGFLIEPNNEDEYIKQLQTMINMPCDKLCELGHGAYNTIVNWDNERILDLWREVYK